MPVAGIWKSTWLPYTETFIRDQIAHIPDWGVLKLGFTNIPQGIDLADYAPYPSTPVGKLRQSVFGARPYLDGYVKRLWTADAHVLHAHFGPGGIEALPISRAAKIPLITTFHGADASGSQSRLPWVRKRYPQELGELFRHSQKLIAVSSYVADALVKSGAPAGKIETIFTGTNLTPLEEDVEERRGIVFVGRLIPIKGPMDLLMAVNLLSRKVRSQTPITIVGDGPLRKDLEEYAQAMKLDVRFTGRLASREIPKILRSHLIFCGPSLPSRKGTREGFGMVFLEASLQQLPCVGYASGGVKEAVLHESTGLLAPEGDIPALSEYLTELLTDTTRAEAMGTAGRARVLKEFGRMSQAAKLASLYTAVSSK